MNNLTKTLCAIYIVGSGLFLIVMPGLGLHGTLPFPEKAHTLLWALVLAGICNVYLGLSLLMEK